MKARKLHFFIALFFFQDVVARGQENLSNDEGTTSPSLSDVAESNLANCVRLSLNGEAIFHQDCDRPGTWTVDGSKKALQRKKVTE